MYKIVYKVVHISLIIFLPLQADLINQTQPFTSIYGVQEAEGRVDNLSVQFQYGIPDTTVSSEAQGGGANSTLSSMALITTNGTAGASAGLRSKTSLEYRSGHEADAFFTVAFTGAVAANATQYIGMFDTENGFAVGFNGTDFGILVRNSSVDSFIPQASFNRDMLNGFGPSGFLYNRSNLNVFRIAYGWLGASIIKFQIMNSSGNWITFHIIEQPNSSATPSIGNPFLPMRAEVFDQNGSNQLELRTGGWNMSIVATQSDVANRYFTLSNTTALTNTESMIFVIRNKSSFQSRPNKINISLTAYDAMPIDVQNISPVTSAASLLRVYKNATVTGTSYTDVDANASVVEYSTAGTLVGGTGQLALFAAPIMHSTTNGIWLSPDVFKVVAYPGDTLTFTVEYQVAEFSLFASIYWSEGF